MLSTSLVMLSPSLVMLSPSLVMLSPSLVMLSPSLVMLSPSLVMLSAAKHLAFPLRINSAKHFLPGWFETLRSAQGDNASVVPKFSFSIFSKWFLGKAGRPGFTLYWLAFILSFPFVSPAQPADRAICNHIFEYAFEHRLMEKPIGDIIAAIGKQFLGKPYEANTLDRNPGEVLVADLHSFDCVTFIENVLAISRCIKLGKLSFDEYRHELQLIRYRSGIVRGYASRLHYFTDWIRDNEKKRIVKDVTKDLGGEPYDKTLDFITTHRSKYPKLSVDSTFRAIHSVENELRNDSIYFIPKYKIQNLKSKIRDGDLIAFTTTVKGLDVSHTGIAILMEDGTIHLLHAPDIGRNVEISSKSLDRYLQRNVSSTGIIILRVLEPNN